MGNLLHTVSLSNCGSSMSILKTLGRWHVRMFCLGDVKMWYRLQFERRTAWRNKTHSENPAGPASGERLFKPAAGPLSAFQEEVPRNALSVFHLMHVESNDSTPMLLATKDDLNV